MKKCISVMLLAVILAGCGAAPAAEVVYPALEISEEILAKHGQMEAELDAIWEHKKKYKPDDALLASLDALTVKSADLVLAGEGNVVYSPLSLAFALTDAALGAEGDTASELYALLGVDSREQLVEYYNKLFLYLNTSYFEATMQAVNMVWSAVELEDEYVTTATEKLFTECWEADFSKESTAKRISARISELTGGMLEPELHFSPDTLLALYNTLYYAGEWSDEFREENNVEGIFHGASGDTDVTYMTQNGATNSLHFGDGYVRYSRGLKDGSMIFILPDEGTDPRQLVETLGWEELTSGGESRRVILNLSLPKFDVSDSCELTETVRALGAATLLSPDAQLTLLSGEALYVERVMQSGRVKIDEKGVSAAAYTELLMYGAAPPPPEVYDLVIDRPFLYAIEYRGVTLFCGIVEMIQ